ncbi:MAG TPA: 50S ribosomal protein L25, partial [Bacteroidota bacterium]|nr:50S ribosomal protein L25 [Bacteroidota bacterium]
TVRKEVGKKAHTLRYKGNVPGIFYGHGKKNVPVTMAELSLKPLYKTSAANIINLKLDDGSEFKCILKDIDFDPLTEKPVHFDLYGINENEALVIEVPVVLTGGTPSGVKEGGILQHILHRVRVSCLPKFIPDHIEINVANLGINKSIHVGDISVPNVTFAVNAKTAIVAVVPPVIEKAPEVAAAEAATAPTEPELIAKGKKPEEGEEGAAAPAAAGAGKAPAAGTAPAAAGKAPAPGAKAPAAPAAPAAKPKKEKS